MTKEPIHLKNRTIFCRDNLDVLEGINSESIDLIYLDPPFNKKKIFSAPIGSSAEGASFRDIFREEDIKEWWIKTIKEERYRLYTFLECVLTIEGSSSYNYGYLTYMAIRLIELHRVLKDTGSLYLHCDPTMSHYLKILMDIIFGEKNFRNEIVWHYYNGATSSNKFFGRKHDIILFYVKRDSVLFSNVIREPHSLKSGWMKYKSSDPTSYGTPNPKGKRVHDVWRLPSINNMSKERLGYPTQKPLKLLERIISASSNEGDMVLDPFCGCATTCVASEKLGRRWIGIDVSERAYELVNKRLSEEVEGWGKTGQGDILKHKDKVHFTKEPPKRTDDPIVTVIQKYVYVISHAHYPTRYYVGVTEGTTFRLLHGEYEGFLGKYTLIHAKRTPLYNEIKDYIHKKYGSTNGWVNGDLNKIKEDIDAYEVKKI